KRAIRTFWRLTLSGVAGGGPGGACAAGGDLRDSRDWHAACDNLRNCSAYGLEANEPASAYIRVERSGAASAPARITIVAHVNEKTTVTLAFDDADLRGLPSGPIMFKRTGPDSSWAL